MPRRNLVPFALVGVLAVLTILFAVLGASSAPGAATVTVQNASGETFGSSASFAMDFVTSISVGAGTKPVTQVRLVKYVPPNGMAVYSVGAVTRRLAVLSPSAIDSSLNDD